MKRVIHLAASTGLLLTTNCGTPNLPLPTLFTNREATLKVIGCSRGCEQYVLYTSGPQPATLYVTNMPDSLTIRTVPTAYVNNELTVVFSGTRSDDRQQISVADASDVPRPAFQAHRVQLTALRRR